MDYETKPVGPWGGQNGSHWDDGVYSGVRQIVLSHGAGIDAIQIEYDKKGYSAWSDKHGGTGGYKSDKVKLNYPEEYLVAIHGYYGNLHERGPVCVRSLIFETNERTYGPFGVEQGTYFSFPMTGGKIVGFHGRSGWYLDAIGAHLKPFNAKNTAISLAYSQNYIAKGTDKNGYSVIQGSIGKDYDIVLAIKQKDKAHDGSPMIKEEKIKGLPRRLSRQSSGSSSDSESSDSSSSDDRKKVLALPPPPEKLHGKAAGGAMAYGPWGGTGGTVFNDGVYTGVRQIMLSRNLGIVWIRVNYEQNGKSVWGAKNGGTGGFKTDRIVFDYPYEILTHITGFYGPMMYMGPTTITSLTFHTNKAKYGPYGEEQGVPFSSHLKEGAVVGFHGRKGLFVDAIGVHVLEGKIAPAPTPTRTPPAFRPVPPAPAFRPAPPPSLHTDEGEFGAAVAGCNPLWPSKHAGRRTPSDEAMYKVVKEPAPCGPGPWGGDGGKAWDDGVFSGIRQIFLTTSPAICSIQIEYDRNGQSIWSVKHGGNGGTNAHRVKLEFPHEVLTSISGHYGPKDQDDHAKVIKSLTFHTTRGKYGPFGEEKGTSFTSATTEGKVVGFHGRSGYMLDAIGVHTQFWLGSHNKHSKPSLFKMFGGVGHS